MNIAEKMYEESCENILNQLPTGLIETIKKEVKKGNLACYFDDLNCEIICPYIRQLEDIGFKVTLYADGFIVDWQVYTPINRFNF